MSVQLSNKQTITVIRYGISKLKAYCERGSILVYWQDQWMFAGNAKNACEQLINKFVKEDLEKYGPNAKSWNRYTFVGGEVEGSYIFVNTGDN